MRQRHKVLSLLAGLSVLTFIDRLAIAVAGPRIQVDLHLQPEAWGWVLSAYVLANGLFEMPSGAMGDRRGQRGELTRIVTWWSAFTALTGWCRGFWQLVVVRFLFGMGTAGAYPNAAGVIARWFPVSERSRSQGVIWAASRLGGVLAPLIIVPLESYWGWRPIFWILGGAGLLWAAVWRLRFHNLPHDDPAMTERELNEIGDTSSQRPDEPIPWARMLHSRDLWLIVTAYGCYGCGSWFYFSWFPAWIVHGAGISMQGILLTSLPFAMGLLSNLVGGELGDWLSQRWGMKTALRSITCVFLLLAALALIGMALVRGKTEAVVLSCVAFGLMDLIMPSAWAMCLAIGGHSSGTATGMMNTAGQAGGFLGTVLFGYIVRATNSYNMPLIFIAAMVLLAGLLFARVDCTRGVDVDVRAGLLTR